MDALFHDLLHSDISIVEKVIRPILVYLFLIVSLRLAGKRELAQLNPFDLVVLMTLSNTVQNAIIGNDNSLLGGLIGAATLLVVNYVVVREVRRINLDLPSFSTQRPLKFGDGEIETANPLCTWRNEKSEIHCASW